MFGPRFSTAWVSTADMKTDYRVGTHAVQVKQRAEEQDDLGLHPVVVFRTNPVHATRHSRRFDDPRGHHGGCALRTGLALLNRILVLTERCASGFAQFRSGRHNL